MANKLVYISNQNLGMVERGSNVIGLNSYLWVMPIFFLKKVYVNY
jgi:hypothetical protein